jgi:hypothetical protein
MRLHKETVQFVMCVGVALTGSSLVQAQELAPATLQELSRTGATPTPSADQPTLKPSLEVSTAAPNERPARVVEQTPVPEELAPPGATAKKKEPRVRERAVGRFKAPEPLPRQLRRHYRPRKLWQLALLFPIIRTKQGAPILLATASALTVDTASGNATRKFAQPIRRLPKSDIFSLIRLLCRD